VARRGGAGGEAKPQCRLALPCPRWADDGSFVLISFVKVEGVRGMVRRITRVDLDLVCWVVEKERVLG
jgi:hypothetical protein